MSITKGYLTKRVVDRATRRGIKAASQETMKIMGYNVIVKDGWVVKKYQDGTIEQMQKVVESESGNDLQLD
jgi:hypothetical protein